jgi:hypothetical protein
VRPVVADDGFGSDHIFRPPVNMAWTSRLIIPKVP